LWAKYTPRALAAEEKAIDLAADKDAAAAPARKNAFNAHINDLITEGLKTNTSALAIASGKRAMKMHNKEEKKKEAFFGVSVYVTMFPGTRSLL
jgi:hypothetical protein